ncbi:MAG: hypothetical protein ABIQ15_00715 [Nocardioides sp.]
MSPDAQRDECDEHAWVLDDLGLASHADDVFMCARCAAVRYDQHAPDRPA